MTINLYKIRATLITALAVVVILFAVIFSLFRAVIPYIPDYSDRIKAEVIKHLGLPVDIGMVDADIYWLVPGLKLLDVDIYDVKGDRHFLHFDEIRLSLDWFKTIKNLKPELGSISLLGLELSIERNKKGNFIIQGFEISDSSHNELIIPPQLRTFLETSSLYLVDSTVHWSDQLNNNQNIKLTKLNLALVNDAPGHQFSIDMQLPDDYARHLSVVVDIEGPLMQPMLWNGQAYFSVKNINLEKWLDDYWQYFDFTGKGKADASVWVEWKNSELKEVSVQLNAQKMVLLYLDDDVRSWRLDGITGRGEWKRNEQGWHVNVRNLKINHNNKSWPFLAAFYINMDQLSQIVNAQADFVRIEDIAHLLGLVKQFMPMEGYNWSAMVESYNPHGDLYNLNLNMPFEQLEKTKFNAQFVDVSYDSQNSIPALSGLDGHLFYDTQAVILRLNSENVNIDFQDLFRSHLQIESLQGELALYRKDKQWLIESDYIYAATSHVTTETKLNIVIADEESIFIDIVSKLIGGDSSFDKLYLPTSIMSKDAVEWFDSAIIKTSFTSGDFLYYGKLDAFPFKKGDGVVEFLFDFNNTILKFLPDWPAIDNLQAKARFYNNSFYMYQGAGNIYGADISNMFLSIDNFDEIEVAYNSEIQTPFSDLLKYIDNSPLIETFGSYVTNLDVKGDVFLNLKLDIPVDTDEKTEVNGVLSFKDNEVYFSEEKYLFKNLNGSLLFNDADITSDNLNLSLDNYPLKLNVKTLEKNTREITRIDVKGLLPVKSLLAPLPVLVNYMTGETEWEIRIDIVDEINSEQTKVDVFVYSDLKGISSTAPGSFDKNADQALPFNLHLAAIDENFMVIMTYGKDLKVTADREQGQWAVTIDSKSLKGTAQFTQDFSLDVPMKLNFDFIDISAFKSENDSDESAITPEYLPPIDFQATRLDWDGREFRNVKFQTHRTKQGMLIDRFELYGPSFNIIGKGSWLSSWRHDNLTSFDFTLTTNNFGRSLDQLALSQGLQKSEGSGQFKWQWPAEPYRFSWDILQGEARIHLRDGVLKDVDVGAGRILGFLNFETLVSFDFGNQVEDGFYFDDINASLTFSQGYAKAEECKIESKVADLYISGRIDLVNESYDLEIDVFPKLSNTVTAIGIATGGPVLGVAVHYFQKILGIDKVAGHKSKVTGGWDNPEIVKIAVPDDNIPSEDDDLDSDSDF